MALNQNHLFEDLDGIKCSIAEKNCSKDRVSFLKGLLETNRFTVVVVKSPPPKQPAIQALPVAPQTDITKTGEQPEETFTVGVTDLGFNPENAIYNRLLRTAENNVVTPAYWKQQAIPANEYQWYWSNA